VYPWARAGDFGHKKECPAPCSGPTAAGLPLIHIPGPALGLFPGPGSAPLGLAGGIVEAGRRFSHGELVNGGMTWAVGRRLAVTWWGGGTWLTYEGAMGI
jgi:hypothetical protein